ncbi:MAG: deoxyribodipyrimidine photo-lyase [Leptospiraceae bacterium]|nr:MAG: deoxyribodipyrimidine photo-lyase [Leptospiraceae bacterium]
MFQIFWFRRDLRLDDNHGLYQALKQNQTTIPIFIFDEYILKNLPEEDRRVSFLFDRIISLKKEIENCNSSLLVLYGKPEEIFLLLLENFPISSVYLNHDYEPYAIERDNKIQILCRKKNIGFYSFKDQVIFEKDELLNQKEEPYKVYSQYKKAWFKKFDLHQLEEYPSKKYIKNFISLEMISKYKNEFIKLLSKVKNIYESLDYFVNKFPEPVLNKMNFKKTYYIMPEIHLDQIFLKDYKNTRDFPYLKRGTSHLSVYLRFGLVSIRDIINKSYFESKTFIEELIWREFYMYILYHYPYSENLEWNLKYQHLRKYWRNPDQDINAKKDFELWCKGLTGYPLVDAGMRELNQTGYMHNRVRMICANFLVKDLHIDWKYGERYFALKLMDFELASNVGNWQWCSGTGVDAAPYFRIFNPVLQQKKFDPELKYCKKWIPELGTKKYPKPMVDHKKQKEEFIKLFTIFS